jgi:hypothetical protein
VQQTRTPTALGQVLRLDEQHRIANFIFNADLGGYSFALGSAHKLPNGNYHFDLGYLPDTTSQSVEIDPSRKIFYAISIGSPDYRSFRMKDLYTPPRTVCRASKGRVKVRRLAQTGRWFFARTQNQQTSFLEISCCCSSGAYSFGCFKVDLDRAVKASERRAHLHRRSWLRRSQLLRIERLR